jgi:hypothetical protein
VMNSYDWQNVKLTESSNDGKYSVTLLLIFYR